MTKAKHTTPDDLVLKWISPEEWDEILGTRLSIKGRQLLENLRGNGNQPINVTVAGYVGRYSMVSQLNQWLRLCGETGYYLGRTDGQSWPETSLQLYVRRAR